MKRLIALMMILLAGPELMAQKSDALKCLLGTWRITTPNGHMVEHWLVKDDSTLVGSNVFVKNGKDTIPQESIEIKLRNGDWYYVPTVTNQNKGQAVEFKFIFQRGTEFISENPAHDFPQRISYRLIGQQLYASIEGRRNGKFGKQNFDFMKVE